MTISHTMTAKFTKAASVVTLLIMATASASAGPIDHLPGRWSGWGSIKLSNGNTEQVKCVATYFVKNAGSSLRQNLRCASASYKIDAVADMTVTGNRVVGDWTEQTHSNSGKINGSITGDNFALAITGPNFTADLALTTSPCKLSINLTPQNFDVTRIAIGLRKC